MSSICFASTEEMRELGNEMQLLIRQGANVAFAFAGLPTSVDGVVVDDTFTRGPFVHALRPAARSNLPSVISDQLDHKGIAC